jgi:nucleoside-diphosphate-sugar epimerase
MNILLIGGTGNISTEVADELYRRGNTIFVLSTGRRPVPSMYTHLKADRNSIDDLRNIFKKYTFDIVIDFVAFVPEQLQMIYTVCKGKIGQFIFISSATVYQKPHTILPITEKVPRGNPYWKYAQDKIACEEFCERVQGTDFPCTIVRPSHTFGKTWIPSALHHSDFTVTSRILQGKPIAVHGDGTSLWTLTAASDFASGLAGLVGNERAIGDTFHITSDEFHSWNEIYSILGDVLGVKPHIVHVPVDHLVQMYPEYEGPLRGDKAENGVFDNSKIKDVVNGFSCKKTLREQFTESYAWFCADVERLRTNEFESARAEEIVNRWRMQVVSNVSATI